MTNKICTKCKESKAFSLFTKSKFAKDGLRHACKECNNSANKRWYKGNKQARNDTSNAYYADNKESVLAKQLIYKSEYPDRVRECRQRWEKANPEVIRNYQIEYRRNNLDKIRERSSQWAKDNPDKAVARTAKRRAIKLRATPSWVNYELIDLIYALAKDGIEEIGVIYHVDHIVPLQGEFVCGLHVHNNLQLLSPVANLSKHNKHDPNEYKPNLPQRCPQQRSAL